MLTGKSILHVKQDIGKCFSIQEIKGYYNNLTEKVLRDKNHIYEIEYLPLFQTEKGENIFFPITIFQYGLGCYDLYLQTGEKFYLEKSLHCATWGVLNQEDCGGFNTFSFIYPDNPYSAMCQGEAVSLFLRMYVATGEKKFVDAAKKALDFMLLPLEQGGTTEYLNNGIIFKEYTHLPVVLNGWIFALFGLFDWVLMNGEDQYKETFNRSLMTLSNSLKTFDCGYWTKYDMQNKIASRFYHNLHIAQMEALKQITRNDTFEQYEMQWRKYEKSRWKRFKAFIKKAFQKIKE